MKKRILYGVADYRELVRDNGYFVDKTAYIEQLETVRNPVFLRPRRFGKSLLCRILECYYNINQRDEFEQLFGATYIGRQPTQRRNAYLVLALDFSAAVSGDSLAEIEAGFNHICNLRLRTLVGRAQQWFAIAPDVIDLTGKAAENLERVLAEIELHQLPPLYVIVDEYDSFANQLIINGKASLYQQVIADGGFFKTFFKTLKEGRKSGAIADIFITGVLPITMDELASGFNIASFITLEPHFEAMLGFTQTEVEQLLDEIYRDYAIDPTSRAEITAVIRNHYNGYHFVSATGEALYNSTILMYFLDHFHRYREIPKQLTDVNLKTDLSWIKRLSNADPHYTKAFVHQLTVHNKIRFEEHLLLEKFSIHQFFEKDFFPISCFFLGILTRHDDFHLKLPNLNMRQIFTDYFNEIHELNASTDYAEIMQAFVQQPDLEQLFAGYWQHYIARLPEAIFQQVNENFYRTTFYELCSRYLSRWFTWNVERSYPQGRSDLEFVGKYHEKFAGLRWVIEFKYYSNAEFKKLNIKLADFQVQADDVQQVNGYREGLQAEYPQARISCFVIYCVGNVGFRVFMLDS